MYTPGKLALTYDDVQLIPQFSKVLSRSHVFLQTRLTKNFDISLPFIASPMDTVCGFQMAKTMLQLGATGCIHRFMSVDEQCAIVNELTTLSVEPIVAAIGASDSDRMRAERLIHSGVHVILIDVAHGDHINVKNMLRYLNGFSNRDKFDVIAGSIAHIDSARNLCDWGADALRVGIGGGSLCKTRIQTGHGIPSLTSILECSEVSRNYNVPVIADGGIRTSGDIAKALAFGAESVMLGSMLAGTKESPGPYIEESDGSLWKEYRGSASSATKQAHGMVDKNVEGESTKIRDKGGTKYIIDKLNDGIRSAFSYSGAHNIMEYQKNADYYRVTSAGQVEAKPHLINR